MFAVHFFDNKTKILSQYLKNVPAVDENIKIKGRKGKVINVEEIERNIIHVEVFFEAVKKVQPTIADNKKRRR